LGDLGAEVMKIEEMTGDPARYWTKAGNLDTIRPNGDNAIFHVSNRNKRSICLDITSAKRWRIFDRLVARTDVFPTNVRQSTKKKLGIDYQTLKGLKARMIQGNISGYGSDNSEEEIKLLKREGVIC
jgi:CoA:oxalate CoA-transferase